LDTGSFSVDDIRDKSSSGSVFNIDYKRILFRALRLWYVVGISLLIGLTIAYLINRYTTRIYPVTASIIIREPAENTDARFLYNNPLVNQYRNYYNEPYIIKSYPLIQQVIEALNFQVSIKKEGNIKDSEQYALPIEIDIKSKNRFGTLLLEVTGPETFRCFLPGGSSETTYKFGDTVQCSGFTFVVNRVGDVSRYTGDQFSVVINHSLNVAERYINNLKVSWAQQGSSVVNLDLTGPIPQKEMDFLDALIRFYHQYDLEKKSQAASRSLIFIEGQLQEIGDSLQLYENALEQFKKKNFVTDLTAEAENLYEQLKTLSEQRAILRYGVNYYAYLEDYLKDKNDLAQVILPSSIGVSDGVLNTLVNQLINLQTELNLLPQSRELQNPMLTSKAQRLRDAIIETRQQILEALINLRNTDKIRANGLDKQIANIEGQLRTLPITQRRLVNLQRNYSFSENMFNFLQQKKAEAGISKASTTSDIVVVNPPKQSGGPITPKITQNYLIFGLIGLVLPFLVFLVIEVVNNKVQSKEDIEKFTSIPFIGGIGHNPGPGNLAVFEKPKSAIAESFRALRSNLNYFTEGKDKKVFMVTSSISGEGKSFTTINLATVFAMANKKTIIIGADMRKPKIFNDFGLSNDKGLSGYLSGLMRLDEVIQKSPIPNLSIIAGGSVPPNPSELLLNARMDEMLALLKQEYDYIFIDTPPLALITDGLVLSKYADHTVFIVRQNYTPRDILKGADDLYTTQKIKKLSLVLNDVFRSGPGYGYGGYAYGYGYGYGYGYVYGDKKKAHEGDYYSDN
jgi:capsular exopolysaccharide synthesis family protein